MQTAVVGASTVTIKTETADGVALAPTVVTVTGSAHDGTAVTLSAVTLNTPTGTHTATMTVLVPTLVTLTWTVDGLALVDQVDVIGRMPITVSELKASDTTLAALTGAAARDAIELAHDEARRITGRSWVRRYDVATLPAHEGRVNTSFSDIERIGAVTVDGVAWTTQQVTDSVDVLPLSGVVTLAGVTESLVTVGVEHGRREPSPQVRHALLVRARQWAQAGTSKVSLYSERVVLGADGGSIVRMLPSAMSTGVAEVDAIYNSAAWVSVG